MSIQSFVTNLVLRHQFKRQSRGPLDVNKARGRYEGWLQYATALGNGIASYDLALLYRARGQDELATRYEQSARSLGFTPPPSLDNKRK